MSHPICEYCGNSKTIPPGYQRRGSPYTCLRKGIGAGKYNERRTWQRRLGYPVDPEYVSKCGDNAVYGRDRTVPRSVGNNRNNRGRRQRSRSRRSRSRAPSRSRGRSRSRPSRSRAPSRSPVRSRSRRRY